MPHHDDHEDFDDLNDSDDTADTSADPDGRHWWPHLIDHINDAWIGHRPFGPSLLAAATIPPRRTAVALAVAFAAIVAGTVTLLWWLIAAIVGAVTGIADTVGASSRTGVQDAAASDLLRTVTDPLRTYLARHATDLPAGADQLWAAWLISTTTLFALALCGSRGARIGWVIAGILTTAMAYAGTPGPGRALAAGLTATGWALLSVLALNRFTGFTMPGLRLNLLTGRRTTDDD